MLLRILLGGALALPLFVAGPDAFSGRPAGLVPAAQAQAVDPRIAELEEQVRRLSGLVEELNFQVLQMQDQIQRMQEDNEFRFQEIEERRSDAGAAPQDRSQADAGPPAAIPDVAAAPTLPRSGSDGQVPGAPPRDFGTIIFDAQGNVREATRDDTPPPAQAPAPDGTTVAALPSGDDAEELYRNSYEFILSGDYSTAEAGFRDLIARFPGSEIEPDAHFWLGEALLAQERPREAAETFLAASRSFPQARMAPEMLYKLGVSLNELNQRDVACATLAEVPNRYPQASAALLERVRDERARIVC